MRERTARAVFCGAVVAAAGLIWAIDTWTWAGVREWVFGQTGAAWVQAVGSILAIVFALRISRQQSAEQHRSALAAMREQHVLERSAALRAVTNLARGALTVLSHVFGSLHEGRDAPHVAKALAELAESEVEDYLAAIESTPHATLPADFVVHALSLGVLLRGMRGRAKQLNRQAGIQTGEEFDALAADIAELLGHLTTVTVALETGDKTWQAPSPLLHSRPA